MSEQLLHPSHMTTLTQAVTSFEAQLSEVVETFTSANDLAETKASQANASAITAFDKAAEALTSKNAASASAANALTSENAASGQADLAANAAATTQTLRDSIIATQGSIGYLPPVAYAAGLSMTLPAQTVSYSGQAYAPLLSALPFTTSGAFETAKFRLIQGVAGVDLAAADGAGMVGGVQPGAGAVPTTLQTLFRDARTSSHYDTMQSAVIDKASGVSAFSIPPGLTNVAGAVNLIGYHHLHGKGDASQLKLAAGAGLIYTANTGVFDDHPHRALRDFRISGDGTYQIYPAAQNGTTTNYSNAVHGSFAQTSGMTFELGAVGMKLAAGYTNNNSYNHYRGNKTGLWLHNVTSHREEGSYFRGNSEAGLLMTGTMQNVTIAGGAIEGNQGRGLWVKDIDAASYVTINLDDVYFEACGNIATDIPAIDIVESDKISVLARAGNYWSNVNAGITSGIFRWGSRVNFDGAVIGGVHYVKELSIDNGSQVTASFNTRASAALSLSYGLTQPAFLRRFNVRNISADGGPVFAVAVSGRATKKWPTIPNLATLAYPHILSKSASVTAVSDSAPDYGDGPWSKVTFGPLAGDYGNNYAQLEYVADAASEFPYKVVTFLIKPEADLEIGFGSSGALSQMSASFRLLGGVTYRLMASVLRPSAGDMRMRMYPLSANQPAFSFFPVYTAKFATVGEAAKFMGMVAAGVI